MDLRHNIFNLLIKCIDFIFFYAYSVKYVENIEINLYLNTLKVILNFWLILNVQKHFKINTIKSHMRGAVGWKMFEILASDKLKLSRVEIY